MNEIPERATCSTTNGKELERFERTRPYDLAALNPDDLEVLLHKRPDLRKEIFEEANRRVGADVNKVAQEALGTYVCRGS